MLKLPNSLYLGHVSCVFYSKSRKTSLKVFYATQGLLYGRELTLMLLAPFSLGHCYMEMYGLSQILERKLTIILEWVLYIFAVMHLFEIKDNILDIPVLHISCIIHPFFANHNWSCSQVLVV